MLIQLLLVLKHLFWSFLPTHIIQPTMKKILLAIIGGLMLLMAVRIIGDNVALGIQAVRPPVVARP